jgi:hypothetical protein
MKSLKPYAILSISFLILALPLAIQNDIKFTFDTLDEKIYHFPAIERFVDEFPNLDLVNYNLAMTPLYHIIMTLFVKLFGFGLVHLRLIHLLISLSCILVLYRYLARDWHPTKALLVSFCMLLSPYILGQSIRLSTDNMAFMLTLATLMTLENKGAYSTKRFFSASILMTLTVLTRQIYGWLIAPAVYTTISSGNEKRLIVKLGHSLLFLIPIAALVPFFLAWGKMTPPNFAALHQSATFLNLDALVYAVSVLGLLMPFFFFWYLQFYKEGGGKLWHLLSIFIAACLFLFFHPVQSANEANTIRGIIWRSTGVLPSLFSTSITYWILFPLGLMGLYVATLNCRLQRNYFIVIVVVFWLLAISFSAIIWQKYYEPFLLFFIAHTLRSVKTEHGYYWVGPVALMVVYFVVDLFRYYI